MQQLVMVRRDAISTTLGDLPIPVADPGDSDA